MTQVHGIRAIVCHRFECFHTEMNCAGEMVWKIIIIQIEIYLRVIALYIASKVLCVCVCSAVEMEIHQLCLRLGHILMCVGVLFDTI